MHPTNLRLFFLRHSKHLTTCRKDGASKTRKEPNVKKEAAPKSWFVPLSPVSCPHFWLGYTEERLGGDMWGLQGEGRNYKVCIHALARQGVRLMLLVIWGGFFSHNI